MAKNIHDAIAHHQGGRFGEAEAIYLELLRANSNDVDALHYLGVLRMSQGKPQEAQELLKRTLTLAPRNADAWNSMGNIASGANDAFAELAFRSATELNPGYAEAWYNLGNLYRRLRRHEDAVKAYRRVIDLNPRFAGAYENIALLLLKLGRADLTAEVFQRWLQAEPENPIARHMAAAYSGATETAPARAEDGYVATMFDRFAGQFDSTLAGLGYAAPKLLMTALSDVLPIAERRLAILDAGCGTGLCGPLLRSSARLLVGVDLSAGMLTKARERGIYDELHEAELVAFMRTHAASYDAIVSADTLVYFGALEEAMTAAAGALKPGGIVAFTVEAEPAGSTEKFRLRGSGRYTHGAEYVRACLGSSGLSVVSFEAGVLRKEAGTDVAGHVVLARLGPG
jgi:predicted TPR repeat methyltransferase